MTRQNPFPGINPWMQSVWPDAHARLIAYICDTLVDQLPDDLVARVEEGVTLAVPLESDQRRRPDVSIVENESWRRGEPPRWVPEDGAETSGRVAESVLVQLEEVTPRWVEIRSTAGQLVTVIELLSPANKTILGRSEFERKLRSFVEGGANVVEIDLIRGGLGAKDARPGWNWPRTPCQIIVSRPDASGLVRVYPCPLREPVPVVGVPLRPGEAHLPLALQPLIDRCQSRSRYDTLDYENDPVPALSPDDLAWARERLSSPTAAAPLPSAGAAPSLPA